MLCSLREVTLETKVFFYCETLEERRSTRIKFIVADNILDKAGDIMMHGSVLKRILCGVCRWPGVFRVFTKV